jgi:hypothetical protein
MTSGLASVATSSRAYRSSAGVDGRGGTAESYWPLDTAAATIRRVSFMKRAREAAEAAAGQAQQAAEAARAKAAEAASVATKTAQDPETHERLSLQARQAMGAARRGLGTVVERIDPGVLADLIIKATALQEMTNDSLRQKRSPYRINEVSISATIPPGVNFAIGRLDAPEELATGDEVSSEDLVEQLADPTEAVISLDGTTLTQEQITEVRNVLADEVTSELKLD